MRNWQRGFIRLCAVVPCASLTTHKRCRHAPKLFEKSFTSSSRIYVHSCLFSCASVVSACASVRVCAASPCLRVCECSCLKRNESESFVARVLSELKRRWRRVSASASVSVSCDRTHTSSRLRRIRRSRSRKHTPVLPRIDKRLVKTTKMLISFNERAIN